MLPFKSTKLFKVTDTHLRLPRAALSGCIRAYVSRSTIGIDLEPHEMLKETLIKSTPNEANAL
jgi:hypothetical protein